MIWRQQNTCWILSPKNWKSYPAMPSNVQRKPQDGDEVQAIESARYVFDFCSAIIEKSEQT
jgi:hypothetical protein